MYVPLHELTPSLRALEDLPQVKRGRELKNKRSKPFSVHVLLNSLCDNRNIEVCVRPEIFVDERAAWASVLVRPSL